VHEQKLFLKRDHGRALLIYDASIDCASMASAHASRAPSASSPERVNALCGKLDRSKIEMVSYYRPPASTACRRDSFRHAAKNNRLAACAP